MGQLSGEVIGKFKSSEQNLVKLNEISLWDQCFINYCFLPLTVVDKSPRIKNYKVKSDGESVSSTVI